MNSFLLWVGGLLVAVFGLLFAVPHLVDWNAYRGVFEEEASRILGRDVRVGGKVNLRLLPSPYVRFEKVRISDSGASLGEPFFRAEAFTLWLSPTPLLKGAVEASEVEFDRPVLRLAVDAEGRGNWQAFRIAPGAIPFVPSEVILQQVRIKEGIVSLRTAGVTEPLTLSGIDGEVSAASLDGPYRFRGMVDWQGARRELRIGTSQREADGKLRYKASIRSPSNGNSYLVDGELSEISAKAQHTGTLTAKLPLSGMLHGLLPSDARSVAERGGEMVDLRAAITGDLDGARLTDMTFAFEHRGKPQLVGGEMVANWRNGLRLETRLAARWLDLDALLGQSGSNAAPVATVRRVIEQASWMLPSDGTSLVTIDIDQVTLGGEALSGVRLALARAGGLTSIGELRASLPGNARGSLRGKLGASTQTVSPSASTASESSEIFDGEAVLRGTSYRRFAAWAGMTGIAAGLEGAPRANEPFSIASRIRLLPAGLVLSEAHLELGGRQLSGNVDWRWGDKRSLDIAAEGYAIDIGAFAPGALDLTSEESVSPEGRDGKSRDGGFTALARLTDRASTIERTVGRLGLTLRAGELVDGTTRLRDVDAEVAIRDGNLSIEALRLTGTSGSRIELQGNLNALQTKPAGTLRGWAKAAGPTATATLRQALPSGARRVADGWLSHIATADVGFSLTLGGATPDHALLRVDGFLDGARTALELGLDGGLARWAEAPISLTLDIDGTEAGTKVLRRMVGRGPAVRSGAETASAIPPAPWDSATLQIRATGATASSLIADARLSMGPGANRATADYKGRMALSPAGEIELAGEIDFRSSRASDLLALASATHRPWLPGIGVSGKLALERKSGMTQLRALGLDIGTSRVAGLIALSTRGDRTRIDGQLTTNKLSIAALLGLVLDGDAKSPESETLGGLVSDAPSPWPAAPFSLALLDDTEGQITITAPTASLAQGLELTDSETRLAFGPRRVEIQSITGAALGGRFTARGTIEGGNAGAGVSLEARITGAELARVAGSSDSGSGDVNAAVTLTGRALSPRAVMATAVGNGTVEIRNGRVRGIAATLVEKAASALIETSDTVDRSAIERAIVAERARSFTVIGTRKLPLEIVDGALRIGALEIATPEANLRNVTTLDLARLQADSEWQIVPRRAAQQTSRGKSQRTEQPLPPISLVWTGMLGGIARVEPRLSIENLEREIQIRKMERDAERLEELRHQDEDRVRLEQERQRQLQLHLHEGGERGGAARSPAGSPAAAAPIIEAPLPVPGSARPAPASNDPAPGKGAEAAPPSARIVRPPSRPRAETKTLQDILMGQ